MLQYKHPKQYLVSCRTVGSDKFADQSLELLSVSAWVTYTLCLNPAPVAVPVLTPRLAVPLVIAPAAPVAAALLVLVRLAAAPAWSVAFERQRSGNGFY